MHYDVCVVGLGGMGSAIAAHCAARGARVIGLEQFAPAHELGSSSGKARMIRKAYFEDPAYVPLVLRAYELWRALERDTDEELLRITGVLAVGRETGAVISGVRRAAREHHLPTDYFSAAELGARYPMFDIGEDEVGVLEPDGGVLNPERAIAAHLRVAEENRAALYFNVEMKGWKASGSSYEILLQDGSRISAGALVLAAGPWMRSVLADLGITIRVQRNVQAWFSPVATASNFTPFLLDRDSLPAPLYGFPDFGDGIKLALHGFGDIVEPQQVRREIDEQRDIAPISKAMEHWMPHASSQLLAAKVCMYSLTSDCHFIIDRHPQHRGVIFCGGFSGHGFKFAPVVGEIAADLALGGSTRFPIGFLSLDRFRAARH